MKKIPVSAAPMSRYMLGAYFGLYPIGLRKAVLRVSKGYNFNKEYNFKKLILQFLRIILCIKLVKFHGP